MRSMLLAFALVTACGSVDATNRYMPDDVVVTDSGLPPYDGRVADRPVIDHPVPDVLDLTDVPFVEDTPDVPCVSMFSSLVRYGNEGGLVAFTEQYVLTAPLAFHAERRSARAMGTVTASCDTTVPVCSTADMVDVGEVNAALAARDVQIAFGMARTAAMDLLYGSDPRPSDGSVYAVDVGGARVLIGEPCRVEMMTGCLNIPVGLQHLVDVLRALHDQELLRPACMAFRGA